MKEAALESSQRKQLVSLAMARICDTPPNSSSPLPQVLLSVAAHSLLSAPEQKAFLQHELIVMRDGW